MSSSSNRSSKSGEGRKKKREKQKKQTMSALQLHNVRSINQRVCTSGALQRQAFPHKGGRGGGGRGGGERGGEVPGDKSKSAS